MLCAVAGSRRHEYKYIPTCLHTYIRTYIHTYMHTYIHTYMHADRQTDRQTEITRIYTCIRTYTLCRYPKNMYIHTYTYYTNIYTYTHREQPSHVALRQHLGSRDQRCICKPRIRRCARRRCDSPTPWLRAASGVEALLKEVPRGSFKRGSGVP